MRLFLPPEQFSTDTALITDTDHLHLVRVLRARVGEDLTLLDNSGNAYHATITQIEKHTTTAHIHHAVTLNSEPQLSLVIHLIRHP